MNKNYKEEFIHFMVDAGVLTFGDFITKSGRPTSYFINTGNYKTGEQISRLGNFYATCIMENIKAGNLPEEITALFGPAYKGIPLAVATSMALFSSFSKNVSYCFNRKEQKDHGEGGSMVGYQLKSGDSVLMVEDVITAGTAVRESVPLLKNAAEINLEGLIISVDRMEKGQGEKTAIEEIREQFQINTFPIVTVKDIIHTLYNKETNGHILIDDQRREKMEKNLMA